MEDIWTNAETVRIPAMPTPTPISAVNIGRPAATTDPNVISSTTRATMTPMPSVEPMLGDCLTAAPPTAMSRPSTSCSDTRSAIASWVATGTSVA